MVNQRISLKDVDVSINGKVIGGAESLTFKVSRDNTEAFEGGNYMPVEIVDGKVTVSGTLKRAFIDVDLLNQLFPNTKLLPSFTLSGTITSGKTPGRDIKIFGAKLDSISVDELALDGHATNELPFKALSWSISK